MVSVTGWLEKRCVAGAEPLRREWEAARVRQRADFHNHVPKQPADPSASVQRLMAAIGAGTREALWAVQLSERKAAVARWRVGPLANNSRSLRGNQDRGS